MAIRPVLDPVDVGEVRVVLCPLVALLAGDAGDGCGCGSIQ